MDSENAKIGLEAKISPDKQYLEIIHCIPGSLADISGLKVGDRIYY